VAYFVSRLVQCETKAEGRQLGRLLYLTLTAAVIAIVIFRLIG